MNSVSLALAWDIWLRGRRPLVYAVAGVVAVLVLLYRPLRYPGPWNVETENGLHYVVFRIAAVVFIATVCIAVGSARRHYARPLSTATIATWLLIPAMLSAALLCLAVTAAFNLATNSTWPLVGPALFCAAATTILLAAIWATAGLDLIRVLILVGIGFSLLHWLGLRNADTRLPLTETWRQLTTAEVLSMLVAIAASYVVAVIGIRLDRSAQLPWSQLPSLQELWLRITGTVKRETPPRRFGSAWRAQLWREWREKAFVGPFILFAYLACVLAWYLAGWSNERGLMQGVVFAGYWLVLLFSVLGLAFGKCGGTIRDPKCSAFLAALPMSDKALSYAILRSAFASLSMTWGLWIAVIAVAFVFLAPHIDASREVRSILTSIYDFGPGDTWGGAIMSLLLALVAMWTIVGMAASIVLTGRAWFLTLVYVLAVGLAVAYAVGIHWLHYYQRQWVIPWIDASLFAAAVLATLGMFGLAIRRRHLGRQDLLVAAAIWLAVLFLLEVALHMPTGIGSPYLYAGDFVFPFVAVIPLFPLAAAPLALAWNRHR
jgi:hypothetical protein